MLTTLFITAFATISLHFLNSTNTVPSSWIKVGKPSDFTPFEFTIMLPQQNLNILEKIIIERSDPNSRNYGKWMSQLEIDTLISSNPSEFNPVIDWVHNTINDYTYVRNADNIYYKTNVDNTNTLFNTEIIEYRNRYTNVTFYSGRQAGYFIPMDLAPYIEYILGVGDFPHYRTTPKVKHTRLDTMYITPLSLQKLYNISDYDAPIMGSQAVVEFQNDQCFNKKDLDAFLKDNALPKVDISQKDIFGKCNMTTNNPDVEATLDIQYQLGVNTNTNQKYVSIPEWLYQFANLLYTHPDPPLVNSISYGWAEWDQCDPEVFPECYIGGSPEVYSRRTNMEFMKLALRGITLVAASGDAGASGRTNEMCVGDKPLNPIFPSSSPYVLSVGGTIVVDPVKATGSSSPICQKDKCIGSGAELNCNLDRCGWTSGGGFSNFFTRPWWQSHLSNQYLNSSARFPPFKYFNKTGRVYPDIALVAHNYLVNVGNNYMAVDGTSASSPSVSGMISILNNLRLSQNKSSVGLVAPLLYNIYNNCPLCFKDVIEGSNNATENVDCPYGYHPTKGFDAVYGLGLPNFDTIYNYVKAMKN